jgi:hypothetical protein
MHGGAIRLFPMLKSGKSHKASADIRLESEGVTALRIQMSTSPILATPIGSYAYTAGIFATATR